MGKLVDFSELKGKTLLGIEGLEKYNGIVKFITTNGDIYKMYHAQDCCEEVYIEDVCGNVDALIGSEILLAEVVVKMDEGGALSKYDASYTWTFYKLATTKGYVTIRWYGTSNGYYSEYVSFIKCEN